MHKSMNNLVPGDQIDAFDSCLTVLTVLDVKDEPRAYTLRSQYGPKLMWPHSAASLEKQGFAFVGHKDVPVRSGAIRSIRASSLPDVDEPLTLTAKHKGLTFHAELLPSGVIEFEEQEFSSASAAGKSALDRSVNGWTFWILPNGEALDSLRKDG